MDRGNMYHEAAVKLYEWMSNLKSPSGEWVVHPQEFLPANVCCDIAGKYRFQAGMMQIIKNVFEEESVQNGSKTLDPN